MERSFFMSTSYPTALSNLSEVSTTDTMDAHRELHNSEIQSLNALETKVGIDGSADTNSIDYKINNLTLSDITDVTASVDEINYVDGVTSAIQTQLDAKASKITSGVENNIVTINNAENIKDSGVSIVDEDDMASDSATKVPTQQSVKAYVGTQTSTASSATPTPTGDKKVNELYITALAAAAEFQAPSGTPANGNRLIIRVKDNGTARALTYNAIYSGIVDTLPSTTTISKVLYMGFIYNSTTSKWEMVAKTEES